MSFLSSLRLISLFEEPKTDGNNALEQAVEEQPVLEQVVDEQIEQPTVDKILETPGRNQSTVSSAFFHVFQPTF